MLSDIGVPGFILLAVLALLLFGPSKLPGLGRAAGKTLREFKREMNEIFGDGKPAPRKTQSTGQAEGDHATGVKSESMQSRNLSE